VYKAEPSGSWSDDKEVRTEHPDSAAVHPIAHLLDPNRPTWRIVLALALPVLAQQLLILSVGLSDRFLAGRLEPLSRREQAEALGQQLLGVGILGGSVAGGHWPGAVAATAAWQVSEEIMARHIAYQAAQTTAIYMGWLVTSYNVLVSVGSTALVARLLGARDQRTAIQATNQSILLAIAFGILGTTVGMLGLRTFVWLLQLRGDAAVFAADYLRPLILLLTFQVIEAAGVACLVGAGDTRTGFWVLGGVALLNLPLAWGLFLGIGPLPELRFIGIALGTAISHTMGGLAVLIVLIRGRAGLRLEWRQLRPDWRLQWRLLRISVPAGVDSLTLMMGHLWFLSIVNRLGDTAASAHGIALGWEAISFLSGSAFGIAAMALVGQNLGAGQPVRAAHAGWVAFCMGCGIMCLMGAVFFVFAPEMFRLFCPNPEQQPIIEAGVPVLRLEAFAEPALACVMIFTYALRGAGDTRIPVVFNSVGLLGVRVPLAYLLASESVAWSSRLGHWGLFGAWMAMFADLYVRGGFFLYRFATGRWKRIQV
jgi:putative MATE family efflux protein